MSKPKMKLFVFLLALILQGTIAFNIDPKSESYDLSKNSHDLSTDSKVVTSEKANEGKSVYTFKKDGSNYLHVDDKDIEITEFSSLNSFIYLYNVYYFCPSGNKARIWRYTSGKLEKIPYYNWFEQELGRNNNINYELQCGMHPLKKDYIFINFLGYKLVLVYKAGTDFVSETKPFEQNDKLYYVSFDPKTYDGDKNAFTDSRGLFTYMFALYQQTNRNTQKVLYAIIRTDYSSQDNIQSNTQQYDVMTLPGVYDEGKMSIYYNNGKMYFFAYTPGTNKYVMYYTDSFDYAQSNGKIDFNPTQVDFPIVSDSGKIIIKDFEFLNDSPNYIFRIELDGKEYFGEGNMEDDQIVFISDAKIDSIGPFQDSQVGFLVTAGDKSYFVCPYKLSGKTCSECSNLKINPTNKNICGSGSGSGSNTYDRCDTGKMFNDAGVCVDCTMNIDGVEQKTCKCDTNLYIKSDASCSSCKYLTPASPYKKVDSQQCEATLPSGTFYVDENLKVYDKCDSSCKTCNGSKSTNCLSCEGSKGVNNGECVNCKSSQLVKEAGMDECSTAKNSSYFFTDETFGVIEYCDEHCETCKEKGDTTSTKCTKCGSNSYKEWGQTASSFNCLEECEGKFYQNPTTHQCENCKDTNTFKKMGNTIACGPKEEGTIVVDEAYGIVEDCYSTCSECSAKGSLATEASQKCTKCKSGFYLLGENCVSSCDDNYYQDSTTNKCVNCKDTSQYKLSGKNNKCVPEPSTPYHVVNEDTNTFFYCGASCGSCSQEPDTANSDDKCETCPQDKVFSPDNKKCVGKSECGELYGLDEAEKKCINCATNTNGKVYKFLSSNQCQTKPSNAYVVEDKKDYGIIETCAQECATCSKGPTTASSNCDSCSGSLQLTPDKNCISACPDPNQGFNANNQCINCKTENLVKYPDQDKCIEPPKVPFYYSDEVNGIIKNCGTGCGSCKEGPSDDGTAQNCKTCTGDLLLSFEGGNCVSDCGNTKYAIEDKKCVKCESGKFKQDGTDQCLTTKPSGYYVDDTDFNHISQCSSPCSECEDTATKCTACSGNYYLNGNTCDTSCPALMGKENNVCVNCKDAGKYIFTDGDVCYELSKVPTTPSFYIKDRDNNILDLCDSSCATCEDTATKCTACSGAYYLNENKCETSCPALMGKENNACVKCKDAGKYIFTDGDVCYELSEVPTTPGFYVKDSDNKILDLCDSSCATCVDTATKCTSCVGDLQLDSTTNKCNSSCPHLYGKKGGVCVKCKDYNQYIFENGDTCYDLNEVPQEPPFFVKDKTDLVLGLCSSTCASCENTDTTCLSCKGDFYLHSDTNTCEKTCSSLTGKKDNKCINCKSENMYKFEKDEVCRPLNEIPKSPAYYVKDEVNNILEECDPSCSSCTGSPTNCASCPAGTYKEYKGTNCVASCGDIYGQNDSEQKCEFCPDSNQYLNNETKKCIPKPDTPFKVINSNGNVIELCYNTCEECNGKGTASNQNCSKCKSGTFLQPNSNNCDSTCPNYYAKENNKCVNCKDEGKFMFIDETTCVSGKSSTEPPSGGLIDTTISGFNILKHCHKNCDTCSEASTDDNDQKCLTCVGGLEYDSSTKNCKSGCGFPNKWFLNDKGEKECLIDQGCPSDKPVIVSTIFQCVENCQSTSSCEICKKQTMYQYSGFCFDQCPGNTQGDDKKNLCYNVVNVKSEENGCSTTLLEYEGNYMKVSSKSVNEEVTELVNKYIESQEKDPKQVLISVNENLALSIFEDTECGKDSSFSNNFTYVDADECIQILKDQGVIGKDEKVLIVNSQVSRDDENTNQAGYSLLRKNNRKKIDLTPCKKTQITISYPIDENMLNMTRGRMLAKDYGVDMTNPEDPFYNDLCFYYSDENGKDVILEDRRNDYFENKTLCEEGCEFYQTNFTTGRVECKCDIKDDIFDSVTSNVPLADFPEGLSMSNLVVVKCYKLVFNWEYIKQNKGFWIMGALALLQAPVMISFGATGLTSIYSALNQVNDKLKNLPGSDGGNITQVNPANPPKKKKEKELKSDVSDADLSPENQKDKQPPSQHLLMFDAPKKAVLKNNFAGDEDFHKPKEKLSGNSIGIFESTAKVNNVTTETSRKEEFEPDELDNLAYEDALENDKRCFCVFFGRLLKKNMIIISAFSNMSALDPIFIKILTVLLTLGAYLAFNAMFFTDSYISKRYKENGKVDYAYVIKYELTKSVLASLAAILIKFLVDYLTSPRKRLETLIKKEEDPEKFLRKSRVIMKQMKCKLAIFICFDVILTLFFWYYISSFCAVYRKTQVAWIEGCLMTFLFCFVFYGLFDLIVAIFRYIGLKCHISCFYTFSTYFC